MNNQRAAQRLLRVSVASRDRLIDAFWVFSVQIRKQTESERLQQIKTGIPAELFVAMSTAFDLADEHLELLFNASLVTLKRRQHQHKLLDSVTSERLDRIAFICQQAMVVFESCEAVTRWMSTPNAALGNGTPVLSCLTEIGAQHVRRLLYALECGGAA